ncbi:hypothetical protein QVD17_39718 [Tagetes erecta]|uniref:Uncharacterized protein n=1 Tax=Tagetes erecta TaxID=13708 RepID=A0AAD8JUQ1_TARER|nr:hypothetical protein QVD17_39718 [Tagetes erecta]
MAMDAAEKLSIGGGLASKVKNIDGIRGILKKSADQITNEKGADLEKNAKEDGVSYAQTLISEVPTRKDKMKVEVLGIRKWEKRFKEASIDEERFLKQKSKVEWLAEGDNNTAFFHKSLKSRNHRSRIDVIMDGGGCIYEGENVQKAFVTHDENFLGVKGDISLTPTPDLFQKRLDSGIANLMIRPITDEEVRKAIGCGASVLVIMRSLTDFTRMSGLVPSTPKSTIFFCNVPDHTRLAILNIIPFVEGSLPVKYLGVPLIASRLIYKDCKVLVEKMEGRITNWKNKWLSFAGRLQLIGSVLSALYIYWASVFILPKRVVADLEAKMRRFFWSQGSVSQGKAKVSWKSVCLPKTEGGLGIRRIGDMNTALMSHHIWSLLSKRKSIWVDWIYSYRLSNCQFWECNIPQNCCWSWRKILMIRPMVRQYLWYKLGNGTNVSAW